MKEYFITFRSVTFAQRGERLLTQKGYRVTLRRTPRWMEQQGCGYYLMLMAEDIAPSISALRAAKIPLRKVYLRGADGKMGEVAV